ARRSKDCRDPSRGGVPGLQPCRLHDESGRPRVRSRTGCGGAGPPEPEPGRRERSGATAVGGSDGPEPVVPAVRQEPGDRGARHVPRQPGPPRQRTAVRERDDASDGRVELRPSRQPDRLMGGRRRRTGHSAAHGRHPYGGGQDRLGSGRAELDRRRPDQDDQRLPLPGPVARRRPLQPRARRGAQDL
ncbi:MAG: hypothetical protein AVDCRST_MAG10-663, partial [uncultured Acidimicrobiales bacterium]